MDDDKNKPGVTQVPLISDLALDLSLPLKPPGKGSRPSQSPARKSGSYPPGYDPNTVDLFEDIVDPIEPVSADADAHADDDADAHDTVEPVLTQEAGTRKNALEENLRAELSDALGTILDYLDDRPDT